MTVNLMKKEIIKAYVIFPTSRFLGSTLYLMADTPAYVMSYDLKENLWIF